MRRAAGFVALSLAGASLFAQVPAPVVKIAGKEAAPRAAAALAPAPAVQKFDPAHVHVSWKDRRWQLVHGEQVLKDFGTAEQDARHALRIIRELGLNELGSVGRPGAGMEYWLVDGHAPSALPRSGLRTVALDPAALRVEQFRGQWTVRDENRIICAFGAQEADARLALDVMKTHRFAQAALLGMGVPSMTVFLAQPGDTAALPGSSRVMKLDRFPRLSKNIDGTPKTTLPKGPSGLEGMTTAMVPPVGAPGKIAKESPFWRSHGMKVAATPAPTEGRVPFDWRRVEVRNDDGDWRLASGSAVLGRFGADADAAKRALSVLRYYRCQEEWGLRSDAVGRWLVAPPNAPRGVMLGLAADPVSPDKLAVVQSGGKWALAEGERVVVPMGDSQADAALLLDLMKRHRIDRMARLGAPGPEGLAVLMRSK